MERTEEALRERVRETPLNERLKACEEYIASMCAERRPPKMTIPLQHYDEDFYIYTTLADAQATIAALQEKLTAALKVKADYDRWLSGGVYFTTAEYEKHAEEHRQREAALQARVKELEEWVQDQSTANLETMRHVDEMQSRAMDAESQLTQRTAELERVRGLVRALPAYKDISVSHCIDENDYESWHVWVDHNPLAECDTEEEANAIKALYEHRQWMEG